MVRPSGARGNRKEVSARTDAILLLHIPFGRTGFGRLLRLRRFGKEPEQERQLLAGGVVVQARRMGLDFRVPGVFRQRFRNDSEAQSPDVSCSDTGHARPAFPASPHEFEQSLRPRDSVTGDGSPRFISVMAELEIRAGDPRAGRLPERPAGNVPKKVFVVADLVRRRHDILNPGRRFLKPLPITREGEARLQEVQADRLCNALHLCPDRWRGSRRVENYHRRRLQ